MSDRNDKEKSSNFLLQNIVIGKNTQEMPNRSKKFKNKLATDRAKSKERYSYIEVQYCWISIDTKA